MTGTNYGTDVPVIIPALADPADIQVAFKQYHTGSLDGSTQAGSLSAAIAAKAPINSPTFLGTVTLPDNTVDTAKIKDEAITTAKIKNLTIVDGDISTTAEIAQAKIAGLVDALNAKATKLDAQLTGTTSAVTLNLTNALSIANGGTGATTQSAARTALGTFQNASGAYAGRVFVQSTAPTSGMVAGDIWLW